MKRAASRAKARGESAAEWVARSTLHPWPKNPRKPSDARVRAVADSIREFGWGRPLVARAANRELVIGHRSWLAAGLLAELWRDAPTDERKKWHPEAKRTALETVVPCRFIELSEAKSHALALADNRHAKLAEEDDALLAEALQGFDEAERTLIGWTEEDFAELLEELEQESKPKKKRGTERAGGDHYATKLAELKKAVKSLAPCVARAADARAKEKGGSAQTAFGVWREIHRELERLAK